MISNSTRWYPLVSRDAERNAQERLDLLGKARKNKPLQDQIRRACSEDILFWINMFVVQYNPDNLDSETGPFVTWEKQNQAVYKILVAIEKRRDLVLEKSRKQGASWLCLLVQDWMSRFRRNKQFLLMSRDADSVDSKSKDSHFWKLDYVHDRMPDWLKGRRERTRFQIDYLDTGSSISGEASTGKAGVGGRATIFFIDEFAQIKDDYEVLSRSSETAKTRIFNSTHLGLDTAFYDICQRVDMDKLVMHWTDDPTMNRGMYESFEGKVNILDKRYVFPVDFRFVTDGSPTGGPRPGVRSPAYDEMCRRKPSQRAVAMDYDIDPSGSTYQFFDRLMIHQLERKFCCDPYWEGDLIYERETGTPKELFRRPGGRIRLWTSLGIDGKPPVGKYGAGADLSTGSGASNTCLSIADATTGEKVLEVADPNIKVHEAAELFAAICKLFVDQYGAPALLAWEMQGPGGLFKIRLYDDLGYRHVFYHTDDFRMYKKISDKPGFHVTPQEKRLLLEKYNYALQKREFLNRSSAAVKECLAWKWEKNDVVFGGQTEEDPSGARDNHGDRVIADALANKMIGIIGTTRVKKLETEPQVLSPQWRYERFEKMRAREDEEIEV